MNRTETQRKALLVAGNLGAHLGSTPVEKLETQADRLELVVPWSSWWLRGLADSLKPEFDPADKEV